MIIFTQARQLKECRSNVLFERGLDLVGLDKLEEYCTGDRVNRHKQTCLMLAYAALHRCATAQQHSTMNCITILEQPRRKERKEGRPRQQYYRLLRVLWPGVFPLNKCFGILV